MNVKLKIMSLALLAGFVPGIALAGDAPSCKAVKFADVGWTAGWPASPRWTASPGWML